jgi:hypothetical protein
MILLQRFLDWLDHFEPTQDNDKERDASIG